jgi:hypothetical protein
VFEILKAVNVKRGPQFSGTWGRYNFDSVSEDCVACDALVVQYDFTDVSEEY